MLKVFLGYVVSVVVLVSGVCVVSPTHAASADIMITQIQAGATGAATQEFIVIYNNSLEDVEITGWCLQNKKALTIGCFIDPDARLMIVPAGMYGVAVSSSFAATMPAGFATIVYEPLSQSSGSITGSSDSVTLYDQNNEVVDTHAWTNALSGGSQLERYHFYEDNGPDGVEQSGDERTVYQDTDSAEDWLTITTFLAPMDQTRREDSGLIDLCESIEGLQVTLPLGMELDEWGGCITRAIDQVVVTELLPNAVGSDAGQEFIELFNAGTEVVDLAHYRLLVGAAYDKRYQFPAGAEIMPGSYNSFTQVDIAFTLLNTSSRVALILDDGTFVSETPKYDSPKEGESWALFEGGWAYTNNPTPGAANVSASQVVATTVSSGSTLKSCADNQYRSKETHRCRLLSTQAGSSLIACKPGQYRSKETNRCRTNVAATAPTPCKEGQERNPETNRCRTVVKMEAADYGVLGSETKTNGSWYVIAAIGGVLLVALGYAVWEWRVELGRFFGGAAKYLRRLVHSGK